MRVFKTKWFVRFARKEKITDDTLIAAIREAESGLNDGDMGGNLLKKRIARTGAGKRGGYRTIIVYRFGNRAIFVYGFAKNEVDNMGDVEVKKYQKMAQLLLNYTSADIAVALSAGELEEVDYHEQKI